MELNRNCRKRSNLPASAQARLAARAIVEEEAGICRHGLRRLMAAIWTGDRGFQNGSFAFSSDEIIPNRCDDERKQPAVERSERKRFVEMIHKQNAGDRSEQKWGDVAML